MSQISRRRGRTSVAYVVSPYHTCRRRPTGSHGRGDTDIAMGIGKELVKHHRVRRAFPRGPSTIDDIGMRA